MNNNTKIPIGLFGDSYMLEQIKYMLKQFPSFHPYYFECHSDNIKQIFSTAKNELEAGLIFDYDSFLEVNALSQHIPIHFLHPSVSSLYRTLYRNKRIMSTVDLVSVDSLSELPVKRLFKEIGFLGALKIVSGSLNHGEILKQHYSNIKEAKEPLVLTARNTVYHNLICPRKDLIYPTDQDMIVALERSLLSTESRRKKEHQAVVGYIKITKGNPKLIETFSSLVEGHLIEVTSSDYILTSKRGIFERVTQGYKFLPLITGNEDAAIHMGIGFHASNKQAGTYSKIALEHALAFKESACYVVREDQSVFGPIAFGAPATYHTIVTNSEAIKEAKEVGMTAVHMDRLKAFLSRKEAKHFTANDFASVSDITLRSAHRILLKWQDANLVVIAGQEKTSFKGRPKVIYAFKH